MMKCYPEIKEKEEMRRIIGRYGLTGKQQVWRGQGKNPRWVGDSGWKVRERCPGDPVLEATPEVFFFSFRSKESHYLSLALCC